MRCETQARNLGQPPRIGGSALDRAGGASYALARNANSTLVASAP
jgi:hypothetical protein